MLYTVGEIEKLTGVTPAMLRDYDKKGLLCPARTGEGVANNRRLYSENDIDTLKKIVTLRAYDFNLKEIRQILHDDEADIYRILEDKILELKREENRLRNLILFAKFVQITDTELFEGLACGPTDIDAFADAARDSSLYKMSMNRIRQYSDDDLTRIFEELDEIVYSFVTLDEEMGFSGVEHQVDRFCAWWDKSIAPIDKCGYLGFWAVFEDDAVIVSEVERIGGEIASGSLQMAAFYVWMKRMMIEIDPFLVELADYAESDIILALSQARGLVNLLCERMGVMLPKTAGGDKEVTSGMIDLSASVLDYMDKMLGDKELIDYIDEKREIHLDRKSLARAKDVVGLMMSKPL